MKKLLSLAVVALVAMTTTTANAVIVNSRSFYKEGPRTTWFIRGGVSLNSISGDYVKYWKDQADEGDKMSFGMNVGFDVSAGFQRFLGKKNIYWGAELGVGTRGFSAKYNDVWTDGRDEDGNPILKSENYKASQSNINVKLPIFIGYSQPIGEHFKIDGHVGPYVSYDFSKSSKDDEGIFEHGYSELKEHADVKGIDAGVAVGLGLWYDHFLIDVTYQKGFIETVNYGDNKGTASHIMLRIGYGF